MSAAELDEEARELIAAGREGAPPSALVRARVQRSVQAKLAAGVTVAAMAVAPSALGAVAKGGAVLALVAAAATGGWYFASAGQGEAVSASPTPPKTVAAKPAAPQAASLRKAAEPTPPEGDGREAAEPAAELGGPSRLPVRAAEGSKAGAEASLADEVALLSKASAALNRGQTERARELLNQYDRLGSKHLIEERSASGVLLLCRSGRVGEAQAAAKRFFKRFPKSPLASRVRASCAGSSLGN